MTREACRAAFAHQVAHEIANQVAVATANPFGCELHRVGEKSPGPVQNTETLHLIITDPTDIAPDGKLNVTTLIRLDTSGVSVLRENAATSEFDLTISELKQRSQAANAKRTFVGVCQFSAVTVRERNAERFLGVYDTALPSKDHHADILGPPIQASSKTQREKAQRRRIKQAIDLVGRCFVPATQFRNGALAKYS